MHSSGVGGRWMRHRAVPMVLAVASAIGGAMMSHLSFAQIEPEATPAVQQEAFGQLPLYFVENRGQLDVPVSYYIQGRDKTVYFTSEGLTYTLVDPREFGDQLDAESALQAKEVTQRWVVKLDFLGASPDVQPVGRQETSAVISYFKGRPEEWQAGLRTYSSIVYCDLWPGIDLEFSGTVNQLKYQFVVRPGANPGLIQLVYRGATEVKVNDVGQLEVSTPAGGFHDDVPYAYQDVGGQRVEVNVSYALKKAAGEDVYGFRIGTYDRSETLVLDPAVLVYCGYIGGSGTDVIEDIAVDDEGSAYVTGYTASHPLSFPVTAGPDLTYNGYNYDAFVAKVNAAGTGLAYCGYIGGSDQDCGLGIAVDSSGSAYVSGYTASDQASFPVTIGPDITYNGGPTDAFVAKVDPSGTGLVYCGYIGGSGAGYGGYWELASGIAVDAAGNAYLAGYTTSTESSFPVIAGPDLTYNGSDDSFVAKVNPAGTGLEYCGYVGGGGSDLCKGIAVDDGGNAYLVGYTTSTESSFPVIVGPDLTYNGSYDAFVTRVNASGTGFDYCGYVGGSNTDRGYGIDVDGLGRAYLTGFTGSGESTFPVAVGPDLTFGGWSKPDAFVARVDAAGTGLEYCGYIGGSGSYLYYGVEWGMGVAVDVEGSAYVVGLTASDQATFPVTAGPDLTYNGNFDAFVAKVNATGTGFDYCGYVGGIGDDRGAAIAVDPHGNAYIGGQTYSGHSSFPVLGGPDLAHNGALDGFVAKITTNQPPTAEANGPYTAVAVTMVSLDASGSSDPDGTITDFDWDFDDDGIYDDAFGVSPSYTSAIPGTHTIRLRVTDDDGATDTATTTITVLTSEEAIEDLGAVIESFDLGVGTETSVIAKLDAALSQLEGGNEVAAINTLGAFINAVTALRGKKISEEDADLMIAQAQAIIESIESGPAPLAQAGQLSGILVFPNPVSDTDTAHFVARGEEIGGIRVEIFDLSGKRIFDSGVAAASEFDWHLQTEDGGIVPNGVYLYRVIVRGGSGEVIRIERGKIVVLL